jgi:hypothetical protein
MSNTIRGLMAMRRSRHNDDPDAMLRMAKRIDMIKTDRTQTRAPTTDELDSAEDAHRRRQAMSLRRPR